MRALIGFFALPAIFSVPKLSRAQKNRQERGYGARRNLEVHREAEESGRCAEVRANWRSGAGQNRREKREKAGAIEGEKEGVRYSMQEHLNDFGFFFKAFCFQK